MNYGIIKLSELGSNCWLPARFCDGSRCDRINRCTYPEKVNCKAIDTEIVYIQSQSDAQLIQAQKRIMELNQDKDIKILKLKKAKGITL